MAVSGFVFMWLRIYWLVFFMCAVCVFPYARPVNHVSCELERWTFSYSLDRDAKF